MSSYQDWILIPVAREISELAIPLLLYTAEWIFIELYRHLVEWLQWLECTDLSYLHSNMTVFTLIILVILVWAHLPIQKDRWAWFFFNSAECLPILEYSVQKILWGHALNMGSKIILLVYQCPQECPLIFMQKFGIWMGQFSKFSKTWAKSGSILRKLKQKIRSI